MKQIKRVFPDILKNEILSQLPFRLWLECKNNVVHAFLEKDVYGSVPGMEFEDTGYEPARCECEVYRQVCNGYKELIALPAGVLSLLPVLSMEGTACLTFDFPRRNNNVHDVACRMLLSFSSDRLADNFCMKSAGAYSRRKRNITVVGRSTEDISSLEQQDVLSDLCRVLSGIMTQNAFSGEYLIGHSIDGKSIAFPYRSPKMSTFIFGLPGSGKTTLLNRIALSGLEDKSIAKIIISPVKNDMLVLKNVIPKNRLTILSPDDGSLMVNPFMPPDGCDSDEWYASMRDLVPNILMQEDQDGGILIRLFEDAIRQLPYTENTNKTVADFAKLTYQRLNSRDSQYGEESKKSLQTAARNRIETVLCGCPSITDKNTLTTECMEPGHVTIIVLSNKYSRTERSLILALLLNTICMQHSQKIGNSNTTRLQVICDEFGQVFSDDNRTAQQEVNRLFAKIVDTMRSGGVQIHLATQVISNAIHEMAERFSQVFVFASHSDERLQRLLGISNEEAHTLSLLQTGEYIYGKTGFGWMRGRMDIVDERIETSASRITGAAQMLDSGIRPYFACRCIKCSRDIREKGLKVAQQALGRGIDPDDTNAIRQMLNGYAPVEVIECACMQAKRLCGTKYQSDVRTNDKIKRPEGKSAKTDDDRETAQATSSDAKKIVIKIMQSLLNEEKIPKRQEVLDHFKKVVSDVCKRENIAYNQNLLEEVEKLFRIMYRFK